MSHIIEGFTQKIISDLNDCPVMTHLITYMWWTTCYVYMALILFDVVGNLFIYVCDKQAEREQIDQELTNRFYVRFEDYLLTHNGEYVLLARNMDDQFFKTEREALDAAEKLHVQCLVEQIREQKLA